jgi:hypothetical protein
MNLRALFPREVRRELEHLAYELKCEAGFDEREPWHVTALVLVWVVREVCKMRESTAR